ncbi:MAG TPA: hypothetical protein VE522_03535 [Actinomycetota bacterium]|nr:hypothetical protein [Actinomycetota bacterium]
MRRWVAIALVVAAMLAAGIGAWAAGRDPGPAISFVDGVPDDLQDLGRAAWDRFTRAFPAHRDCLVPVTVDGVRELDDRAAYDPHRRLVTVRIPGTAPNLEASLVHEFAHHLEFTCPAQRRMRAPFLAAQGASRRASWFGGPTWETTPSEGFAEGVAEFVLGRRPAHARIDPSEAAMGVIRRWAVTE